MLIIFYLSVFFEAFSSSAGQNLMRAVLQNTRNRSNMYRGWLMNVVVAIASRNRSVPCINLKAMYTIFNGFDSNQYEARIGRTQGVRTLTIIMGVREPAESKETTHTLV